MDAPDPEAGVEKVLALVRERIPRRFGLDPMRDIQVLCPMNRGGLGARSLNVELQQALNPPGEVRVERFGWTFCPGDKVMQVVNDHERQVYNGDLGVVARMDMEEGELVVDFEGREVAYGFGELDELVLAYATTVHKSQGSEYPAVVVPLTTQHFPMLQRNLVYTGGDAGQAAGGAGGAEEGARPSPCAASRPGAAGRSSRSGSRRRCPDTVTSRGAEGRQRQQPRRLDHGRQRRSPTSPSRAPAIPACHARAQAVMPWGKCSIARHDVRRKEGQWPISTARWRW